MVSLHRYSRGYADWKDEPLERAPAIGGVPHHRSARRRHLATDQPCAVEPLDGDALAGVGNGTTERGVAAQEFQLTRPGEGPGRALVWGGAQRIGFRLSVCGQRVDKEHEQERCACRTPVASDHRTLSLRAHVWRADSG